MSVNVVRSASWVGVKAVFLFSFALVLWSGAGLATELSDIRVISSVFPPYSYEEDGEVKGAAVVTVRKLLSKLGISPKIEIYPWARAFHIAKKTPNTMIFSVARNAEREPLFKWIGKIVDFDVHVFRKSDRHDISISNLDDLGNFMFAGLLKDVKTAYLKSKGVDLFEVRLEELAVKMLYQGRVDLMASDRQSMQYRAKKLGYRKDDFVSVIRLADLSKPLYLVINNSTDDHIVETVRRAFEGIRN